MLSDKRFRLTRPTVGIQLVDGTAKIATVPTDGIIKVLSGPDPNHKQLPDKGLVYVRWEEQIVALFAVDIEARGIEIPGKETEGRAVHKSATA